MPLVRVWPPRLGVMVVYITIADRENVMSAVLPATSATTSETTYKPLSPVSFSDRILVMDKGRIVEDGTHEELMRKNNMYAHLFREQAQWYDQETGEIAASRQED